MAFLVWNSRYGTMTRVPDATASERTADRRILPRAVGGHHALETLARRDETLRVAMARSGIRRQRRAAQRAVARLAKLAQRKAAA
jgi:hypothetical protein